MVRKSKWTGAWPSVSAYFEAESGRVYTERDLRQVFGKARDAWGLPTSGNFGEFLRRLLEDSKFREAALAVTSSNYALPALKRYSWGPPDPYALGASLRTNSYLSHGTALFLHGITEQLPKRIYVNKEQSAKPKPKVPPSLSQHAIDRAFAGKQRTSNLSYVYEQHEFVILAGKWTNKLQVGSVKTPKGIDVAVTRLERTLIDIVVRPSYSGSIFDVLQAFKRAKDRVQVRTLVATLQELDHAYPYHQAIGFLMERAGYPESSLQAVRELGLDWNFHLTHGAQNATLDARWRVYVPQGL